MSGAGVLTLARASLQRPKHTVLEVRASAGWTSRIATDASAKEAAAEIARLDPGVIVFEELDGLSRLVRAGEAR